MQSFLTKNNLLEFIWRTKNFYYGSDVTYRCFRNIYAKSDYTS